MAGERTLKVVILGDAKDAQKAFGQLEGSSDRFGSKLDGTKKMLARWGVAAVAAGAAAGTAFGVKAVRAASDLGETVNKAGAVFEDSSKTIEAWAKGAARDFGQSQRQALDAASTFGNLFRQLGTGAPEAAKLSMSLTELASDFASFHNADPTQVIEAMTAAFRGEYDAVQRFVPTINAATVEQKALAMTGKAATKELTAQEKALAAQTLLMEGAGKATGDFDKTSGGLANQTRILRATMEDLSARIGAKLVPIVSKLADAALGVLRWWEQLSPAGKTLAGVVAGLTGAVFAIVQAIKAWAAIQAAINFLLTANPIGIVIVAVAALAAGIVLLVKHWDTVRDTIGRGLAVLADLWSRAWGGAKDFLAGIWEAIVGLVRGAVDGVRDSIGRGMAAIAAIWSGAWNGAKNFVAGIWDGIVAIHLAIGRRLADAAGDLFQWLRARAGAALGWVNDRIGDFVGGIRSLPARFANAAGDLFGFLRDRFRDALNWIVDRWNRFELKIGGGDVFGVKIPEVVLRTPDIPRFAEGGIVTQPTLGIIGEAGPEAVIPLGHRGRGAMVVIENLNMPHYLGSKDMIARELADLVGKEFRKQFRSGGQPF